MRTLRLDPTTRIALPAGTILQFAAEIPLRGLVSVEWNGEALQVYAEDIRLRGFIVEAPEY